ncbi:class I SAM-dependent methyltransferase [Phyllobacterium sp. 628]|uniref:class I SAM-dependent methyltransferase n=1 Tax=Phyllobacterium sp. 628 TaxID=2718938 RepID=UPI00166247A2|nr:class I SAM-dependent methyltransferase [Phyllobacterium sp. 628]QND52851.1 class I SAM-dependent methyltransferase [Phyllobacterium sp. 628]
MSQTDQAAKKFDSSRAAEYETQSRIALAGYEACHELAACILAAALGTGGDRRILVVGVGGTAQEVIAVSRIEPTWTFVGVDPSEPMLALATERLKAQGLSDRVELNLGTLDKLAEDAAFDGAMMLGVLHHLPGDEAKSAILKAIANRVTPGGPLILAGNRYAYASKPLLLTAWGERWRMHGGKSEEVKAKIGKILQGADPPHSEDAVFKLLDGAGFERPECFFTSLFWGAWFAWRKQLSF